MGEAANSMLNGEACSWCGVHLEARDKIYMLPSMVAVKMPTDGSAFGSTVVCLNCGNHG